MIKTSFLSLVILKFTMQCITHLVKNQVDPNRPKTTSKNNHQPPVKPTQNQPTNLKKREPSAPAVNKCQLILTALNIKMLPF